MSALFEASKWLHIEALLSAHELELLFLALDDFKIFRLGRLCSEGQELICHTHFLDSYKNYIDALKNGDEQIDPPPAVVLTRDEDSVHLKKMQDGRVLVQIVRPVIQVQHHKMAYSTIDQKFRSMVMGQDTIPWGLQFSYPQLCKLGDNQMIAKVDDHFQNTKLFSALRRFIRNHTLPTPFIIEGKKMNATFRIGNECLAFINDYQKLKQQGLQCQI